MFGNSLARKMKKVIGNQLAIANGIPVRSEPYPPWPHYPEEQVEEAAAVLRSGAVNYWTGTECREFEREFAQMFGVNHAVAVANGTVALELALEALDIGPGDEVIVTPRTFLASVSAIVRNGAMPVFADVDPDSQNRATGFTPLMFSASKGHEKATRELVKANANLNLQGKLGETALMLAAANSKRNTAKVLIKAGADLNLRDNSGITALGWAIQNKHKDTRKELQKAGAKQ